MADKFDKDDLERKMLEEIRQATSGGPGRTASMWPIGQKLGLDRGRTEDVAMGLVAEGLLEIKSLSGGLGLTEDGLKLLGSAGGADDSAPPDLAGFLTALARDLPALRLEPAARRDLELDLQTLQLQGKRTAPLPGVVGATLQAVEAALKTADSPLARAAARLIG
ncbi:MAG: hypothetical protein V1816_13175 [Pseudomonadota bacterium]